MRTWSEVYKAVPAAPFNPSAKDEQALTDAFEDFVGGPEQGFRLMRLYTDAVSGFSGYYPCDHHYGKPPTVEQRFIAAAAGHGFTEEQAKAYLSVR